MQCSISITSDWPYIQDYFEYIIKNHESVTDNPLIRTFVDEIENRITLRIKTGYFFVFVTRETIKLLGKIT